MHHRKFVDQLAHERLHAAIHEAEAKTSGEIRVMISHRRAPNPVGAAQAAFLRLGMQQTRDRNAVLLFVAPRSRTFAVIGDEGVHTRCGDAFWTELAAAMTAFFKRGDYTDGLVHGIRRAGELLAEHFPHAAGDGHNQADDVIEDSPEA